MKYTNNFFIVGCGRSGTTLLRKMLNSHELIAIPLESLFIIDYLQNNNNTSINRIKKNIVNEFELKEWGLMKKEIDLKNCKSVKDIIIYLHKLYCEKNKKKIWGQKTPRFIRHYKLLKQKFPESKFIHVIRDPRAVVSSLIQSDVHASNAYYGAKRWNYDVECGINLKKKFPKEVLEIKYEDLVSNPEIELKKICRFLNISFDPQMLKYYNMSNEYGTYYRKIHHQLNKAPNKSRIEKWKNSLSYKEIELIESICKTNMEHFNYKPINSKESNKTLYIFSLKIQRILLKIPLQIYQYVTKRKGYIYSFVKRKLTLKKYKDIFRINY